MKITELFQRHLFFLVLLWAFACILMKPGWLTFAAGISLLAALTLIFAPERLWYGVGLFTFNPEKSRSYLEGGARQLWIPVPTGPRPDLAKAQRWTEAIPLLEKALTLTGSQPQPESGLGHCLSAEWRI